MRVVIDGHDVEQNRIDYLGIPSDYYWECKTCKTGSSVFFDTEDEALADAATHAVKKMTDAKNSERA